jgi:predicted enzyme related to lactoylglutathione lyase
MSTDRVPPDRLARPLIIDVAIDVNDLAEMARFYESLLQYERAWDRPGHVYLIDPSGRGPHVYLQQVPEPRTNKNRLHLDVVVPSLPDAVEQAVQLGASRVEERRTAFTWFEVLADPEGNLFCLVDLATWQQSKPPWWQHADA